MIILLKIEIKLLLKQESIKKNDTKQFIYLILYNNFNEYWCYVW